MRLICRHTPRSAESGSREGYGGSGEREWERRRRRGGRWTRGWGGSGISGGGEGLDQRERGNSRREGERKKGERDEVEWKFGISMEKEVYDFVSFSVVSDWKKKKREKEEGFDF